MSRWVLKPDDDLKRVNVDYAVSLVYGASQNYWYAIRGNFWLMAVSSHWPVVTLMKNDNRQHRRLIYYGKAITVSVVNVVEKRQVNRHTVRWVNLPADVCWRKLCINTHEYSVLPVSWITHAETDSTDLFLGLALNGITFCSQMFDRLLPFSSSTLQDTHKGA